MLNLIFKGFLMYVVCLLGINSFLICTRVSFADKSENENSRVSFQRSNDDGDDDDDDDDDGSHRAGENCLTSGCHSGSGEERFYIGGTIYTDAKGTNALSGAKIKVRDTNGKRITLKSDRIGNFYTKENMNAPFKVTASYRRRKAKMSTKASSGGCNASSCHVVGSAGRIFISKKAKDLDLTGTVTDSSSDGGTSEISYNSAQESSSSHGSAGAAISGAKVKLSKNGSIKYRTTTNSTGAFVLGKVKAGEYTLKISKKGYKLYTQTYQMNQSNVASLEITLDKKQ